MSDEVPPSHPRYAVYPLVGDQCQFDEELHAGNDKVVASLAARRHAKAHPLGVILLEWGTGKGLVWREYPPLNGHPVELLVNTEDVDRWFKDWAEQYVRQRRN